MKKTVWLAMCLVTLLKEEKDIEVRIRQMK